MIVKKAYVRKEVRVCFAIGLQTSDDVNRASLPSVGPLEAPLPLDADVGGGGARAARLRLGACRGWGAGGRGRGGGGAAGVTRTDCSAIRKQKVKTASDRTLHKLTLGLGPWTEPYAHPVYAEGLDDRFGDL